ncbi:MAG: cation:proton antiporter, partial [Candidatus Cloacimonetes bacterium]|nr:cation:proton antiporter [Candidatus Cloacimonadota bacterium]
MVMGLSTAFLGGLAMAKMKLSPIVGYILAGVLIGPFTPGFVGDAHIATQLAEIGIVLLMFGVGLHFSLKDLMAVKAIALPGAIGQILAATAMGALAAHYWGWGMGSGLLFGLALSVASTVVLLRALEDENSLQTVGGHIAVGWLIVEDLVIVLALVLLPALAPGLGGTAETAESGGLLLALGIALVKIVLFLIFMLVFGKRFLPRLLSMVARTRSRELFTLAVFVVAVGVAFGVAYLFDISFALGAFFAGMMIKGSELSVEVTEKALPFQDAFAVLFFVSVGMIFNPAILMEQPLRVFIVVMIIILGKSIAAFLIVQAFGYSSSIALKISASLAQIGEFSFILATLGLSYGLLTEEANSLILAGALISISLNPIIFRFNAALEAYSAQHPTLSRWLRTNDKELSRLKEEEKQAIKKQVILVGHGRVGSHFLQNIENTKTALNLVIIDLNRERVENLRSRGFHAIFGDAAMREILEEASIAEAKAIVLAVPDPYQAQNIVTTVREIKP